MCFGIQSFFDFQPKQGILFDCAPIKKMIALKHVARAVCTRIGRYCWFGGVLALAITVTVMLGMGRLGPTLAVATILIAQLSAAAAIDAFGIMGTEKLAFGWSKWAGLALMTGGVLLFKMK